MDRDKRIKHILRQIRAYEEQEFLIKTEKRELAKKLCLIQDEEEAMEVLEIGKSV